MSFLSVIIAAGGTGSRMNLDIPKQFYRLDGKTILEYSVTPFDDSPDIDEIIIVTHPDYAELCRDELKTLRKPLKIADGGKTRQDSVYNGLIAADKRCSLVLVHDGARPFVTQREIKAVVAAAENCAAVVGTRVNDTIKLVGEGGIVETTPDRKRLWAVQTPQAIPHNIFVDAYKKARETGFCATDDVSLAERFGCHVKVIEGGADNIKITTQRDLLLAKLMLEKR